MIGQGRDGREFGGNIASLPLSLIVVVQEFLLHHGPGQLAAEMDVQSLPFLKSKRRFRLTRYSRNPSGGIARQTGGLAF
jgi:hypothetical protein